MKKLNWFYLYIAVYSVALIKGFEWLISKGAPKEDVTWMLLWILLNGVVIGRESIKLEMFSNKKEPKSKTRKK